MTILNFDKIIIIFLKNENLLYSKLVGYSYLVYP